ncbi:MAG: toll/interleukin-1 receptor domain-containing protein [Phycisphaerae bacterium]|jgi:hypothetical protein|nr:toll/interleukin-1 receptor domain-containing protein [Phycisphaerae bacterium]
MAIPVTCKSCGKKINARNEHAGKRFKCPSCSAIGVVPDKPASGKEVFIAYSHKDKAAAHTVIAALESHHIRCWIAPRDISPGLDWSAAIARGIDDARVMILIYSNSAGDSKSLKAEIKRAIDKQLTILPFRIDDSPMSKAMEYLLGGASCYNAFKGPMEEHILRFIPTVRESLPTQPHQIFISHSQRDQPLADHLCSALEADGVGCWMAPRDARPGVPWGESIINAIGAARAMVLIYSKHSSSSPQVLREVERAIAKQLTVLPFRIDDSPMSKAMEYLLSGPHWYDAITPPVEEHVRRFTSIVRKLLSTDETVKIDQPQPIRPVEIDPIVPVAKELRPPTQDTRTVFISYRREDGSQTARLLRAELQQRGYQTFLDVDDLKPGHFDEALLNQIESARNFLLILSPNSLKRCSNDRDWLRREIVHALKTKRNIIPVLMPEFEFPEPDELPEDIRPLSIHHGIQYNHDYFDAMIKKLDRYLGGR